MLPGTVGLLWVYCRVLLPYYRASTDEHPISQESSDTAIKEPTVGPKYEEMARQMRADGVSEAMIDRFVAEEMEEDEFRRGKGITEIEALRE